MAARTHSYTTPSKDTASRGRRSSPRATLAVLCGIVAVVAIPLAIEVTRKKTGAVLLDAAWAIPVAAVAAVITLAIERRGRRVVNRAVGHVRGSRRLMAAHVLAVTAICLTLSSALAVGVYEFLVWKETH